MQGVRIQPDFLEEGWLEAISASLQQAVGSTPVLSGIWGCMSALVSTQTSQALGGSPPLTCICVARPPVWLFGNPGLLASPAQRFTVSFFSFLFFSPRLFMTFLFPFCCPSCLLSWTKQRLFPSSHFSILMRSHWHLRIKLVRNLNLQLFYM